MATKKAFACGSVIGRMAHPRRALAAKWPSVSTTLQLAIERHEEYGPQRSRQALFVEPIRRKGSRVDLIWRFLVLVLVLRRGDLGPVLQVFQ